MAEKVLLSQAVIPSGRTTTIEDTVAAGIWKSCHLRTRIPDVDLLDTSKSLDIKLQWFDSIAGWRTVLGYKWEGGLPGSPSAQIDSQTARQLAGKRVRVVIETSRGLDVEIAYEPSTQAFVKPRLPLVHRSPVFYGTESSGTADNTTTFTFAHTVGTASSRFLHVGVGISGQIAVSGITWNGSENLSVIRQETGTGGTDASAELWGLVAPTETTDDVVVTIASSARINAGATNYNNVNQSTPTGAVNGAQGSATSVSTSLTTLNANSVVLDAVNVRNDNALNVGALQTERWEVGGVAPRITSTANSEEDAPTAQAYTISYSWTDSDEFAHAVGELNEVAAAAANPKGPLGMPLIGPFGGPIA